ncbi:MAG TPA: hypothetical protein VGX24_02625 [Pyrinomonadaceae bacterium]|nr:hypothetical protein [Pyrinomonadaceae bacterium]
MYADKNRQSGAPPKRLRDRTLVHLLSLSAFSSTLFLPLIGKGFVHDDFVWLYIVSYESSWYGLTHPIQLFYTPLTWLTFKADWMLWGLAPFPIALENLALHISNTLLLYWLAFRLWRSDSAAWWAGFGFALFYMANSWAVMWIAARPHLLATLFCLAAAHASVSYARRERRRVSTLGAIVLCVALSMLAKEIGVASVAVVFLVLFYVERSEHTRVRWRSCVSLLAALIVILSAYLMLRAKVGAVSVLSNQGWYHYTLEFGVLFSNLLEYVSRTYLIAGVLIGAIALSRYVRGARPRLKEVTRYEIGLSVALFAVTLAPVILIRGRSGLYTYLPGIAPALLLGAAARALYASAPPLHRRRWVSLSPIVFVVVALSIATVGQSLKWMRMAKTNMSILHQIAAQHARPTPGTKIILRYAKADRRYRFPDGFGTWSFPYAVKLLYRDPTLNGEIVSQEPSTEIIPKDDEVNFVYQADDSYPKAVKIETR